MRATQRECAILRTTLISALIAATPSRAACIAEQQGAGRVADIIDVRTFRLIDGAEIRLAGIEPLRSQNRASELAALIAGRDVTLHGDSDTPDRYGRQPAFVRTGTGSDHTVQADLLARGAAINSGAVVDRPCAAELAAAEAVARRAKRGIWSGDGVIKNAAIPGDILAELGRFVVVEGRVSSVREAGTTTYLNFGRRWTRDFAVTISRRMMPAFAGAGIAINAFAGRRIRVRGWVESRGGPRIEARHVGQIEAVGDD